MIVSAHGHLFTSLFFCGFIALSLGLTWWSMRRARDATGFFVAGRRLTGWQNGLAISGDYMSAASFLGIAGLVSLFGFDGLLYSFGFIVGWGYRAPGCGAAAKFWKIHVVGCDGISLAGAAGARGCGSLLGHNRAVLSVG